MTHTLGRLEIEEFERPNYSFYEITAEIDGKKCTIADVFGGVRSGQSLPAEANARRMVACWNALAGIPVEAIEDGFILEVIKALSSIVGFCDDPSGSEQAETLVMGLARMLPTARAALSGIFPPTDRGEE